MDRDFASDIDSRKFMTGHLMSLTMMEVPFLGSLRDKAE
jgi:hypothetical protein